MEIRSFLAFELPGDTKKTIARVWGEMNAYSLNIRWIKVDNIHLTVVFMGNVPQELITPMGEMTAQVCRKYGPFQIALKGVGVFPHMRRPRVLWIGLDGDIQRMADFRGRIQQKMKSFCIKQDRRPFKPHLTMGRFRKGSTGGQQHLHSLIAAYDGLASQRAELNELVLFRSDLKPNGAVYTRLNAWPLTGES